MKTGNSVPGASGKRSGLEAKPRAKERVLAFLEEEFVKGDLGKGARLPTGRALAAKLGVSVSTVQSVFQDLSKKGIIRTQVGNGSFLVAPIRRSFRLGLSFGALEFDQRTDLWQLTIYGAILKQASRMEHQINVIPINLAGKSAREAKQILEEHRTQLDGIILRPTVGLYEMLSPDFLSAVSVVNLNQPTLSATSNFVSADYQQAWHKATRAMVTAGRKCIVYLAAFEGEKLSVADMARNAGITSAIGSKIGREVEYRIASTGGEYDEDAGYHVAKQIFTDDSPSPDAILCSGDWLAHGVRRYCDEHGINIPEKVSILGGIGIGGFGTKDDDLTCIHQPLNLIGAELAEMVYRLMAQKGQAQPAVYLPMDFNGGGTTRPEENRILELSNVRGNE